MTASRRQVTAAIVVIISLVIVGMVRSLGTRSAAESTNGS